MPELPELWTGQISQSALENFHVDSGIAAPKLTADHIVPRKIAAIELLTTDWPDPRKAASAIEEQFLKRFGRYHYITPTENKRLVQFQKKGKYKSTDVAYASAGIHLRTLSREQLKLVRSRHPETIQQLLAAAD